MSKDWTGNGNSVFKTLAACNHSGSEHQWQRSDLCLVCVGERFSRATPSLNGLTKKAKGGWSDRLS